MAPHAPPPPGGPPRRHPVRHPGHPVRHPGHPVRHPGHPVRHPGHPVRYPVEERPEVDVRHADGDWYAGRLHAWLQDPAARSRWWAVVTYYVATGIQHYGAVPADDVRPRS